MLYIVDKVAANVATLYPFADRTDSPRVPAKVVTVPASDIDLQTLSPPANATTYADALALNGTDADGLVQVSFNYTSTAVSMVTMVRFTDTNNRFELYAGAAGGRVQLYESVSGTRTLRGQSAASVIAVGQVHDLVLRVEGAVFTVWANGTELYSYTSSGLLRSVRAVRHDRTAAVLSVYPLVVDIATGSFDAAGSVQAPGQDVGGTGQVTAPAVTGSGSTDAPGATGSGSGTVSDAVAQATGNASAPSQSASGTGTASNAEATGVGSAVAPDATAEGAGGVTAPASAASGSATAPGQTGAGTGSTEAPTPTNFSRIAVADAHAYADGTYDAVGGTVDFGDTSASPDSYGAIQFDNIQVDRYSTINSASFNTSMINPHSTAASTYHVSLYASVPATLPATAAALRGNARTTAKNDRLLALDTPAGNVSWTIVNALQEMVNRPDWVKGSSIVVCIKGASTSSRRSVHRSVDNSGGDFAPVLTVDFTSPTTYAASGGAAAPGQTASGTGTQQYQPSTAAGGGDAPSQTASGVASASTGGVTGLGSADAPGQSGSGTGTVSTPGGATASGSASAPAQSATGSAEAGGGASTAAGGAAAPGQTATGTGRMPTPREIIAPTRVKPTPHIRLLNRSRQVLAILDIANPPSWSRKRNEATEISVTVPRGDIKLPYTQVASLIEIWEGERRLIGGRISGRDVGPELVAVRALTEEILLEQHLTPVNYSQVFANLDLADVARRCLDNWHTLRVNRDWTLRRVEQVRVDLATMPGFVMLERRNGGYVRSGYTIQRFYKSEIPRFKDWERVRWAADFDDPVFTTLQFRYLRNGVWSAWIPNRQVSVGTTTGVGERGVMPETYGLTLAQAGDADAVDIGCNLYTDDIDSQEEETSETKGVTPIWFALEVIARTHGHVAAGSIPNSAGVTVKSVESSGTTALAVLRAACEQVGWEFRVEAAKLSIAKEFGRDRRNDFLLIGG